MSAFWLIVPCLACDFLMVPVLSSLSGPPSDLHTAFALGIVGCVLAQGCLLAAFLAWSDGPFLWRLLVHWLIALGLYLVWLVGFLLSFVRDPGAPHMAATVGLGVPLVSVAAQLPLWLARQFWGWRLVQEDGADIPINPLTLGEGGQRPGEGVSTVADISPDRKLAIRDLMLATAVVAVSLALARLAPLDGKDKDGGPVWLVVCVVASVISSITILPAGAWLMRPVGQTFLPATESTLSPGERVAEGRLRVGQTFLSAVLLRGLLWSILYASAWISLVWIICAVQWWFALPLAPRAIYVGFSSVIFSFASTVIVTALLARSHGYRLTGLRDRVIE